MREGEKDEALYQTLNPLEPSYKQAAAARRDERALAAHHYTLHTTHYTLHTTHYTLLHTAPALTLHTTHSTLLHTTLTCIQAGGCRTAGRARAGGAVYP